MFFVLFCLSLTLGHYLLLDEQNIITIIILIVVVVVIVVVAVIIIMIIIHIYLDWRNSSYLIPVSDGGSPIKCKGANDSRQSGNNPPLWKEGEFVGWSEQNHWAVMDPHTNQPARDHSAQETSSARGSCLQRWSSRFWHCFATDIWITANKDYLPGRQSRLRFKFQHDFVTGGPLSFQPVIHLNTLNLATLFSIAVIISGSSSCFSCHHSVRG